MDHYILNGHEVEPATTNQRAAWYEHAGADRQLFSTRTNGVHISTVFLGLDHQSDPAGPPHIFETMIFWDGNDLDNWCQRYATWDQAAAGHDAVVRMVLAAMAHERRRVVIAPTATTTQPFRWPVNPTVYRDIAIMIATFSRPAGSWRIEMSSGEGWRTSAEYSQYCMLYDTEEDSMGVLVWEGEIPNRVFLDYARDCTGIPTS
jgi:hypothetical protein